MGDQLNRFGWSVAALQAVGSRLDYRHEEIDNALRKSDPSVASAKYTKSSGHFRVQRW